MRRWMEEMMSEWKKEKEEMKERIKKVKEELKGYKEKEKREMEIEKGERKKEEVGGGEKKDRRWEDIGERVRRMEIEGEMMKREEKKKNIIIRGVKAKKEGWEGLREEVEEIVRETGAEAKIEEIKRIGKRYKDGKDMVMVRFENVRDKIQVMKGKRNLRERSEWIKDDLTEKERRVEWLIREEAEVKRREGLKVRVGYMKLWIEGKLWRWDEEKDKLKMEQGIGEEGGRKKKGF
ncbi:PREDICTED: golgin subfamily A member 6-like protein 22 [Vollenhovia emeryi]|uniref:golgin subfamily A member 6-like protein 22 n=1 Tax=Vollenhovia emeryi TaxID=411798 RepID=UPI0005F372A5|nr:PREDICTED: golgin subfamily A member 6-like protein 22 [Vollenhovia emeryi]